MTTINEREIQKFSKLADEWWDANGKFKPLHVFNPIRIKYIIDKCSSHFNLEKKGKEPLSTLKVQNPPNWSVLELGLDRDNLKERILQRTKNMFLSGILEETNHLISKYGFDLPILETIGYREAKDVLNNHSTIDKAIELTTTKTIQFAKRQKTWFRNKNNPLWLDNKNLLKDAIIKIESFLS